MKPGDLICHTSSREEFVFANNQNPIPGLEWIHGPETIYAYTRHGQRVPLHRDTIHLVEVANPMEVV